MQYLNATRIAISCSIHQTSPNFCNTIHITETPKLCNIYHVHCNIFEQMEAKQWHDFCLRKEENFQHESCTWPNVQFCYQSHVLREPLTEKNLKMTFLKKVASTLTTLSLCNETQHLRCSKQEAKIHPQICKTITVILIEAARQTRSKLSRQLC